MMMPLGGGVPTTLASAQLSPLYIAVDSANVYWGTANTVQRCARTGCGGGTTQVAATVITPDGIAVANGTLYLAVIDAIYTCAVTGCGSAPAKFIGCP